jgi:hypothetical protein
LDDKRNDNRRRNNYELSDKPSVNKPKEEETINDDKFVKPQSGSIYDRGARPLPKINRRVPLIEKNKFVSKQSTDKSVVSKEEDDYAHEYDDEIPKSSSTAATPTTTVRTISVLSPKPFIHKLKPTITQQTTTAKSITTTTVSDAEYYDDEYYDTPSSTPIVESSSISAAKEERIGITFKSRLRNEQYTTPTTTAASSPDSFRLNRYSSAESNHNRPQSSLIADSTVKKPQQTINAAAAASEGENNSKKYANKQTVFDHVTQETPSTLNTQNLFQNLYNNRNLDNRQQVTKEDATQTFSFESKDAVKIVKRPFLPSRGGNPFKARGLQPVGVFAQQSTETHENSNPSQQSKLDSHKITLEDLYNEEYDVDLNDALNPMLKPLTSSRGISEGSNQQSIVGSLNDKDAIKAQNQKAEQQIAVESAPAVGTTEPPEYYDDELEYTYADDVA